MAIVATVHTRQLRSTQPETTGWETCWQSRLATVTGQWLEPMWIDGPATTSAACAEEGAARWTAMKTRLGIDA